LSFVLTLLFSGSLFRGPVWAQSPSPVLPKENSRVEELMIWQISESLDLPVKLEAKLSQLIHELNSKKSELSRNVETSLKALEGQKDAAATQLALRQYRRALQAYGDISLQEVDRMRELLGHQKAAQYFLVKGNFTNRIRQLLGSGQRLDAPNSMEQGRSDRTGPLSEPKLIEE